MRVEVRPAVPEDIPSIAERMRQADRDEVMAGSGASPEQALTASLALSTYAWTGLIDDEPACMFGVAPLSVLTGRGLPWLLGTDLIEKWPRTFLRRCRPCLAAMLAVYPVLENFVDDRNTLSKQWLGWLGFVFAEKALTIKSGAQFRHFKLEGADHV